MHPHPASASSRSATRARHARVSRLAAALTAAALVAGSLASVTPASAAPSSIDVGSMPSHLAISPDGSRLYVTNAGDGTMSVIDTTTQTVTATVTGLGSPTGVAVSPDGTAVYVADLASPTVSVVATASNTVVDTITVGDPELPLPLNGVAFAPDGSRAYVTGIIQLSVIDVQTGMSIEDIPTGMGALEVAVTPDGAKAYVTNNDPDTTDGTISAINLSTGASDLVTVGGVPYAVAVSPDGTLAYVTDEHRGLVIVLDTADDSVIDTIPVGESPFAVAFGPDGETAYVSSFTDGTVSVIDVGSANVAGTIKAGDYAWGLAVAPDGHTVYVANTYDNSVLQIMESFATRATVTVNGSGDAGDTLSASVITHSSPTPSNYHFRWFADGTAIPSATGTTFTPGDENVGDQITVTATPVLFGYNGASGRATSAAMTITEKPPVTIIPGTPMIMGTPTVGTALTVDPGSWSPSATPLSYQWFRTVGDSTEPIAGASHASYTPNGADVYSTLSVRVTGTLPGSADTRATSESTAAVPATTLPHGTTAPVASTPDVRPNPGSTIRIHGKHFTDDTTVNVWLHSTPMLIGSLPVGPGGGVSGTVTLPASVTDGGHRITLVGTTTGFEAATASLTLDARAGGSGGSLASTGFDSTPVVWWGGLLALIGSLFLFGSRLRLVRR